MTYRPHQTRIHGGDGSEWLAALQQEEDMRYTNTPIRRSTDKPRNNDHTAWADRYRKPKSVRREFAETLGLFLLGLAFVGVVGTFVVAAL